ncbi:MAG TPA: cation:proton antiporter [Anaerolinea thermolimosa]|uniref:Cation:proton antiporter n=1 Tax=Anaerolinea thermolimosa TaxID=229919 RepID=A0A3D1JF80_9CHLR|nr:cation:proton antiporter [Anaerolinea thermolimosa]GAP07285.1 Kef-type K+ transport systems, membrane components [Anaerolinea thermolimosa]HCE17251.1 cation:proton antiporter [Anaerolinea thermolimosa]
MSPFLQLILSLAVIILAAKAAGYLSTRIGQPSVFGELLIGLILGPSLLDLTHIQIITDKHLGEVLYELGEVGVLTLMFLAGLELEIDDLTRNTRVSALAGILGVLVPVGMGWLAGRMFQLPSDHAIFLGLTLGATSVSISAQVLMELNVLRSRVGLGLLGAAVFDDILVILLLSVFTALSGGDSGLAAIGLTVLKMIAFLVISVGVGLYILPWVFHKVAHLGISQGTIALAVVVMLFYGLAAELIGGMAAITGTFVAGLMLGRTPEKRTIEHGFAILGYGFFVPIFFVNIGLQINVRQMPINALWLFLIISAVAISGKLVGAGLGARLGGFSWRESLQLGTGMISRGEVGLIVASVGLESGLLEPEIFSTIVGMVLVTTLVTPPMLRRVCSTAAVRLVKEAS